MTVMPQTLPPRFRITFVTISERALDSAFKVACGTQDVFGQDHGRYFLGRTNRLRVSFSRSIKAISEGATAVSLSMLSVSSWSSVGASLVQSNGAAAFGTATTQPGKPQGYLDRKQIPRAGIPDFAITVSCHAALFTERQPLLQQR